MKPYKIIEENETHIVYEYRTVYTWILYATLLIMVAGMIIPNDALTIIGSTFIALYFIAKLSLGHEVNSKIQEAMRINNIQLSGNKASFGNPLRIKLSK